MSAVAKLYIKHTIHRDYRLLLLVIIVQILILQNLVMPVNLILSYAIGINPDEFLFGLDGLLVCICFMAFCIPLYQFRYLMKRNSSDLYLSLPIKREHFFDMQFLMGAGQLIVTTLVALGCSSLLSMNFGGIVSRTVSILLLEVLGLVLYALFTWIIVKCNTLLDGILISIAYTLLPLLIMITMYLFSARIVEGILLSEIYGAGDIINSDLFFLITSFLSTPITMLAVVDTSSLPFAADFWTMTCLFVFWVVLGIGFYIFAKKAYIQRKGEQSGERTKTWMAYPIMIPLFTGCLLLIVGATLDRVLYLMFVFIGYLVMYFFAKRSLKVTPFMIIQFLCLFFLSNGLEQIMIANNCFGNVQEVFELEEIRNDEIRITYETRSNKSDGEIDVQIQRYTSLDWHTLTEKDKQSVVDFHKEVLTYCEVKDDEAYRYRYDNEGVIATVSFSILAKASNNRERSYTIQSEQGMAFLNEKIQSLSEMGILLKHSEEESLR